MDEKWKSRKFATAIFTELLASFLLIIDKIEGDHWVTITMATVVVFVAAQAHVDKK